MFIRSLQADRKTKSTQGKITGTKMGLSQRDATSDAGRTSRKVLRVCPAKRSPATTAPLARAVSSGKKQRPAPRQPPDGHDDSAMDPCDNSNDSGLGFEQTTQFITISPNSLASLDTIMDESRDIDDLQPRVKRSRLAVKAENEEEESDNKFRFSSPLRKLKDSTAPAIPLLPLTGAVCATTKDGQVTLSITSQPEQQHRARYQTEGSRGAVKDRSGQGFPIVRLSGYNKPARLQVFIGSDVDRVTPHMFYQACRVCGKNSTPCTEQKVEGTVVIELHFDPLKKMIVTCDCVGILKERNVDVEHRFPEETVSRSKKKSTRCRMVFRTCVERPDGTWETLQVVSQAIACTQLPGIPEICKRSLNSSPCTGGVELFLLGKNFLKDSRVVFQQPLPASSGTSSKSSFVWEEEVIPDKEFLQPTHLVCVVPPFHRQDLSEPVSVRLFVRSSGKCSEPQSFLYLPSHNSPSKTIVANKSRPVQQSANQTSVSTVPLPAVAEHNIANKNAVPLQGNIAMPLILPTLLTGQAKQTKMNPVTPNTTLLMLGNQPTSQGVLKLPSSTSSTGRDTPGLTQQMLLELLKQKNTETPTSTVDAVICPVEARLLQQFVSENTGSPLPAQSGSSVEKFLSKIESGDQVQEIKTDITKNETVVSSTSHGYPGVEQNSLISAINTNTVNIQSQSLAMNIESSSIHIPKDLLNKDSVNKIVTSDTAMTNSIEPLPKIMKQEDINYGNSAISLPEALNVTVPNSNQNLITSEVLEHVMIAPDSTVGNLKTDNSVLLTGHQPVISLADTNQLLPPSAVNDALPNPTSAFQTDPNAQLLNNSLVEPIVQHLVDNSTILVAGSSVLPTQNNTPLILLNEAIGTNHFKSAETSLINQNGNSREVDIPVISNNTNQAQENMLGHELESEAHLINTQLGQLLTTDLMPESRTAMGGPLVRDVLLGSGAPPPVLHHTDTLVLGGEVDNKKADTLLPQELTHMSERDLLSYINTNCFDQVMP